MIICKREIRVSGEKSCFKSMFKIDPEKSFRLNPICSLNRFLEQLLVINPTSKCVIS